MCAVEFHSLNFNLLGLISVQYRKEVNGILLFGLGIGVLYILFPTFLIASNNAGLAAFPTSPNLTDFVISSFWFVLKKIPSGLTVLPFHGCEMLRDLSQCPCFALFINKPFGLIA